MNDYIITARSELGRLPWINGRWKEKTRNTLALSILCVYE